MQDNIKDTLSHLMSAIQAAKIYSIEHPKFEEFIDQGYKSLRDMLKDRAELIVGIVDGELSIGREIFFDLSLKLGPLITYLQERQIERIAFHPDLKREELINFISFLTAPQEDRKQDTQESLRLMGIMNIKAGRIRATEMNAISQEMRDEARSFLDKYQYSLEMVDKYTEALLNEEELDGLELRFNVNNFVENLLGMYQEFLDLTLVKSKDITTYIHLLNVAVLSMYISSKVGFSKDEVLDLGIAALFHDIGKLSISRALLQKKGKLEAREFSRMEHHTDLGAKILLKYIDTLGTLPAVVAFEHHLRYDLRGYPKLPFSQKPHPVSLLISQCDVYDALAQKRPYKRSYPPLMIYEIMMKGKGKSFDPKLLDEFFRIIGIWPVKTIVTLSDGRIAVVKEQNENDIFNPKVEVISPEEKKGFIDLSETKQNIKIENSLDPYKEGKKYLHLA
jgi:HD-GYP domain-containing protein (c-di-GMP phosphodiesterase class II)